MTCIIITNGCLRACWFSAIKVSEADACEISSAICEELGKHLQHGSSQTLLKKMKRLYDTGHSNRVFRELSNSGLAADIKETYVNIGWKHPVFCFRDVIECLSRNGKMQQLVKDPSLGVYANFWEKFQGSQPDHPIYAVPTDRRKHYIPCLLHADEGTSQKKRPIMVLSVQPLIGDGTSYGGRHINFVGNSLTTRYLYTTIMGKCYRGKHSKRLTKLVDSLAQDMKDLFDHPVSVSWHWFNMVPVFSPHGESSRFSINLGITML